MVPFALGGQRGWLAYVRVGGAGWSRAMSGLAEIEGRLRIDVDDPDRWSSRSTLDRKCVEGEHDVDEVHVGSQRHLPRLLKPG